MENIDLDRLPGLPRTLAFPLALVPNRLHSTLLASILNLVFAAQIRGGELEFLRNRAIAIRVLDADIEFRLTLLGNAIAADSFKAGFDLCISGTVYDYLTLVSRREDTDTLFFQRRLNIEGDTQLGLYVKNFLDGVDAESLCCYEQADFFVQRGMSLYERLFS